MNAQAPIDGSNYLRAWQRARLRPVLRAAARRLGDAAVEWLAALEVFTVAELDYKLVTERAAAETPSNDDDDGDNYGG